MADEADSKSVDGNIVWVQVPLPAVNPLRNQGIFFVVKHVTKRSSDPFLGYSNVVYFEIVVKLERAVNT